MRTIETLLAGGADQLAAERQDTDWGAAKEGAVLAALRLIRTAFSLDSAVVAALRQTEQSGGKHHQSALKLAPVSVVPHCFDNFTHILGHFHSCRILIGPGWTGFYETLDGIIKRDRRWLPSLLDYVCYAPNPAIQAQAVHITLILNQRLPQLPDLLLQPVTTGMPLL